MSLAERKTASVRGALATSFATGYTSLFIYFVGTMFLARLLTPTEIGIYSIGAVVIAVGQTIRDFGIGQYIIQEKELTPERLRCAFTLTVIIAWTVGAILAGISGPVSRFYNEPGVQTVILILSVNLLLVPFGSVIRACWRRNLDFKPIYVVSTASALAGTLSAVGLAYLGFSYRSQAISVICASVVTIAITWALRPADFPWRPGFRGFRRIFSFSSWLTSANIVGEVSEGLPDMIVGRINGAEAVGFIGKAIGTVKIFEHLVVSGIFPVILPHFSSLVRSQIDVAATFLKSINYLTCLAWPFFMFLYFAAESLIHVLYGSQWDASIPLVRILIIHGILAALMTSSYHVLVAMGAVRRILFLSLLTNPAKLVALLLLAPFGIEYATLALVLAQVVGLLINIVFIYPVAGTSFRAVLATSWRSLLVTLLTTPGPLAVSVLGDRLGLSDGLQLLLAFVSCLLLWLVAIQVTRHPLRAEMTLLISKVRQRFFAAG